MLENEISVARQHAAEILRPRTVQGGIDNEHRRRKVERKIPILVYEDIPSAHDFLIDAFGFASGGVQRTPDGVAVHGEVRAGDLVIWLH